MAYYSNSSDINQTFIIEPISLTGGAPTVSACTAVFTNNVVSCDYNTTIFLGDGIINFDGNLYTNDNLTANTINASTYYSGGTNVIDIINQNGIVSGSFSSSADTLTLTKADSSKIYITGFTDYYTTGATLIGNTIYFDRNDTLSAYTVNLSTFTADTYVTGVSFTNNQIIITRNDGVNLSTFINTMTGLTINGLLSSSNISATTISTISLNSNSISAVTLTSNTINSNNISAQTISATTITATNYNNLPLDIKVTGFTYSSNTFTIYNNSGQTFPATFNVLTGLTVSGNQVISGASDFLLAIHGVNEGPWAFGIYNDTYNSNQAVLGGYVWNNGNAAIGTEVDTALEIYTNADYLNPTMIISSTGTTLNNDFKINGSLSANTIYGNGSNITNIQIVNVDNLQSELANKFDKSGGTVTGSVLITGDVTVMGTATTINTQTLTVKDNIITLNSNATGNTVPYLINSGIEILRNSATTATLLWNETNGYWMAGLTGSSKQIILSGDSLSLLNSGHTHPISEIVDLQSNLNNKLDTSGGTISGGLNVTNGITATTYYGNGSNLTGISKGGGGGGQLYYFNISNTQSPYYEFSTSATSVSQQSITVSTGSSQTAYIGGFMTPSNLPNVTDLPAGITSFYIHAYVDNSNTTFDLYCELYKRTIGGTETLLLTSDPVIVTGTFPDMYVSDAFFSGASLNSTDRLVVKVYATNTSNNTRNITMLSEGNEHYSFAYTTIPTFTNTYVTGFTYSNNTLTIKQNNGQPDYSQTINQFTGLTINGNLNVIGNTTLSALTSNTISATTYQNLPISGLTGGSNISITGSNGSYTVSFTGTTGSNFTGGTVTGATIFTNGLTANTISATTYYNLPVSGLTGGSNISITGANGSYTVSFTGTTGSNFTGGTVSGATIFTNGLSANTISATTLTIGGSSTFKGGITATTLSGTTDRMMEVNSGGTVTASKQIISGYLTSGGTVANLLENTSNWDIDGNYTGSTITGTYQGQKHYNGNYFFEAVADNLFIRLIRG